MSRVRLSDEKRSCALAAVVLVLGSVMPAAAEDAKSGGLVANPSGFLWEDAPPAFPRGAQVARLSGDPARAAPFAVMIRLPGGYDLPPHWHDQDRQLLVVSGRLFVGVGGSVDLDHAERAKAGSYLFIPAKTRHWLRARTKTMFEMHGVGPLDIRFVDRKK